MKYGSIILEKKEYVYLQRILNMTDNSEHDEVQKCFAKLGEELKTAHIVDEEEMPSDIIRFNSTVSLALENGLEKTLQLVIPTDKDEKQNKISVLTPMGSALIGYSTDDTILWNFPEGMQKLKILGVEHEDSYSGSDLII